MPAADTVVPMPRRPGSRRAIAWTSWFATRVARRSSRANTSGSLRRRASPFISRQITCAASSRRDLAALDAAHAVAHDAAAAPRSAVTTPRRRRIDELAVVEIADEEVVLVVLAHRADVARAATAMLEVSRRLSRVRSAAADRPCGRDRRA